MMTEKEQDKTGKEKKVAKPWFTIIHKTPKAGFLAGFSYGMSWPFRQVFTHRVITLGRETAEQRDKRIRKEREKAAFALENQDFMQKDRELAQSFPKELEEKIVRPQRRWLGIALGLLFPLTALWGGLTYLLGKGAQATERRKDARLYKVGKPLKKGDRVECQAYVNQQIAHQKGKVVKSYPFEWEVAKEYAKAYAKNPKTFDRPKLSRKFERFWINALFKKIQKENPKWSKRKVLYAARLLYKNKKAPQDYGSFGNNQWRPQEAKVHSFELVQTKGGNWIPYITPVHKYFASGGSARVKYMESEDGQVSEYVKLVSDERMRALEEALQKAFGLLRPEEETRRSSPEIPMRHMQDSYLPAEGRVQRFRGRNKTVQRQNRWEMRFDQAEVLMDNRVFTESEWACLLKKLAEELAWLHDPKQEKMGQACSILHMDIKPDNIMLRHKDPSKHLSHDTPIDDIQVTLIDFNISAVLPEGKEKVTTKEATFSCATDYQPPETSRRQYACAKSDIYALGKSLPAHLQEGDGALSTLLKKMVAHGVDDRPSAKEVLSSLEEISANRTRHNRGAR